MASGVKVEPECVDSFNIFKLNQKKPDAIAFIIYGFTENFTKIRVLDKEPLKPPADDTNKAKNAQWSDLVKRLPENDVRYAVADVHYNTENGPRTEIVFITWAPESASIKQKMVVASSKEALRKALSHNNNKTSIQATCYPDLDLRNIVENLKGFLD